VGWTYLVCSRLTHQMIRVDSLNWVRSLAAARLAGLTAALALAFCTPFWIVSNRFHPATFHLFLLLSTAWVFLLYVQTGKGSTAAGHGVPVRAGRGGIPDIHRDGADLRHLHHLLALAA